VASDESGKQLTLLLTRRLTGRLINGFASLLEKSSIKVAKAPAEMRNDVVLLEHQWALTKARKTKGGEKSAEAPAVQPRVRTKSAPGSFLGTLVTGVNVTTYSSHFGVIVKNGSDIVLDFTATRSELHRILDMLRTKANQADWGITLSATWLEPASPRVVMN